MIQRNEINKFFFNNDPEFNGEFVQTENDKIKQKEKKEKEEKYIANVIPVDTE